MNAMDTEYHEELCFICRYCISKCAHDVFTGNLGNIHYDDGTINKEIPIVLSNLTECVQ